MQNKSPRRPIKHALTRIVVSSHTDRLTGAPENGARLRICAGEFSNGKEQEEKSQNAH